MAPDLLQSGGGIPSVPLAEAKNRLSSLVARVEHGEEIAITRRGVPVVHLVAASQHQSTQPQRAEAVAAALAHLRDLRTGLVLEGDVRAIAREGLA